jgi:hypothetical protein
LLWDIVQDLVVVFFLRASFATANRLLTELKQPLDGSSELISGNGPDSPYTGLLEAVPPPQIQLNLQDTKKYAGVKPDGLVAVVGARCCGRQTTILLENSNKGYWCVVSEEKPLFYRGGKDGLHDGCWQPSIHSKRETFLYHLFNLA